MMELPKMQILVDPMNITLEELRKLNLDNKHKYPVYLPDFSTSNFTRFNTLVPTTAKTIISNVAEKLHVNSTKKKSYKKYHKVFNIPDNENEEYDDEKFLPVEGYANYYISNYGRVFYYIPNFTSYIKPALVNNYLQVHLRNTETNNLKYFYIHRLVAIHFIPNPLNKPVVDHIDSCTTNNKVSNLRWATQQENGCNKSIFRNNKSGYPGIKRNVNIWTAQISHNGELYNLGDFYSFEEAVAERKKAELLYFKEFANTNTK